MGRHAALELDAPTEHIEVVAPQAEDDRKPLLPTWFLPGLFGAMALAVVLLLIALAIGNGHHSNSAIPAAAPSPTVVDSGSAKEQRYLSDLTSTLGDASFYGPQYGRERVDDHSAEYVAAGREACKLAEQGYTNGQVQVVLARDSDPQAFGEPPSYRRINTYNVVFYAWKDLC